MSGNIKYAIAFNNTLKQFIDQLQLLYPLVEIFETASNMFHLGLTGGSKTTYISGFYEAVYKKHKDRLIARDSDFFEVLKDFDMIPETEEVRAIYRAMNDTNRKICWDYVSILTKLTGKYYEN